MSTQGSIESRGLLIQGQDHFTVAQALYHAVTGKTESMSHQISENFEFDFNSVTQLHYKLKQMCSQWTVISSNENITVRHMDDNKEVFSSYERFELYDKSRSSAIESIQYQFNVLIQLPNSDKPQPYKVEVVISSKIAALKKYDKDFSGSFFLRLYQPPTLNIEVEYVDYTIARNILATIDSWTQSLNKKESSKLLTFFQQNSHLFGFFANAFLSLLALYFAYSSVDKVGLDNFSNLVLAKFGVILMGIIYLITMLGKLFTTVFERSVDRIFELGYIKINVGDDKLIAEAEKRNLKQKIFSLIALIFTSLNAVLCGFVSSMLYSLLVPSV